MDGICASFILEKAIRIVGGNVDTAIPHRITDGYGLNEELNISSRDGSAVYTTLKPVEENKKLYEKNIRNEKFKNDYFVNLSHELRTPINVILSTVQLINSLNKDKDVSRKRLNYYMEIVQKSSNSLLKIINDIIDSSKIEAGSYKINKEDNVDIVYLVEETALTMRNYIKERGIELIIDPEIEEKYISCDPNEIERCIINIVSNAGKFTQSRPR